MAGASVPSASVGRSVALLQIRERIMGREGDRRGITQLDTGVPHSLDVEGEPLAELLVGRTTTRLEIDRVPPRRV